MVSQVCLICALTRYDNLPVSSADRDSFLPGALQRYHQLLIPALQLVAAILFTSGPKHTTANQQVRLFSNVTQYGANVVW